MNFIDRLLARASGKAMAELHPEVQDREHLAVFRSDGVMGSGTGAYSYLQGVQDYESYVWVRKAIKVISDNFSVLPLKVMRGDQMVTSHPLIELLTNVNDTMTSIDLWNQWVTDMLLGGEEGWELVKNARGGYAEVWPRQPHMLYVSPDESRKRYYSVDHYTIDDGNGDPYRLNPDELVHFKFFNPRNPWRGISPITAVRMSILIDTFAQAWSKLFFNNSARPDYAVIAPEGLTSTERNDIETKLSQKFGGAQNAHKPIVLEQGVSDIKILSFPPKDMEWIEQRKMSREEVGAIFGVPDEIMGWGRDTYENFDTAVRVLWELTIIPLATQRDTHLTEYFQRVAVLRPDEFVVSDLSNVDSLSANETEEWTTAKEQIGAGALTINEWRAQRGLKPLSWGDEWWAPISLAPIGSKPALPPATPAKAWKRKSGPEYGSAEHEKVMDIYLKRTNPWEKKMRALVMDLFKRQQDEVEAKLRSAKAIPSPQPSPNGRGSKATAASVADDPFDLEAWIKTFKKEAQPLIREMVAAAGVAAIDDLGIGLVFDVDRPAIAEFIRQRAQRFAEEVNQTTWEALRTSLGEGLDAGEGVDKLMARVEAEMGDRIRSSSETIARTETQGATSGGTIEAWRDTGVVEGKTWLSALIPNRSRQEHMDAHGQTVGLDEQFDIGGVMTDGPGLSGDAGTDINCLCTITAVINQRGKIAQRKNGHAPQVDVAAFLKA
jgi:HK97 family phage portal protein